MKKFLLTALMLLIGTVTHAQTDCAETETFCDETCTVTTTGNCPPASGCSIYNFQPACTGYYTIDAWTTCPNGANCDHCMTCVQVLQPLPLITCYTSECKDHDDICCKTCGSIYLTASVTYQVKVCLMNCLPDDSNCEACTELDCSGCICLRYAAVSACCTNE